jgi:hypothetical protein
MQVTYLNSQTANLVADGSNKAVFNGTTVNINPSTNYSDGQWTSGSVVLGNFGSVSFNTSTTPDGEYHDYTLFTNEAEGGPNLSNLTAEVWAANGYSQQSPAPITIKLPDPGSQDLATPILPLPPTSVGVGDSSLDPTVLQQFITNQEMPAYENYFNTLSTVDAEDQSIVTDRVDLEKGIAEVSSIVLALEAAAALVEGLNPEIAAVEFCGKVFSSVIQKLEATDTAKELGQLFPLWVQSLANPDAAAVQSALQVVETDQMTADDLAAETLLPTRIVVTGTSDDTGTSAAVIGGSVSSYHNVFQAPGGNYAQTIGTSVFSDSLNQPIASGPITTQNYFDSFGNVDAESTISTPEGLLHRRAVNTGPVVMTDDSAENVASTMFPTEFDFSPEPSSPGAFTSDLSAFNTIGNVTTTTASDGSEAVLITEDSPSSLATVVTVPNAPIPLLAMGLRWTDDVNSAESASFTVTFTDASRNTTVLYTDQASDPSLHDPLQQQVLVSIPSTLRGETGVLQFSLTPSETDGVQSQIMLGGFTLASISPAAPPPASLVYALYQFSSLDVINASTGNLSRSTLLQLPNEFVGDTAGLAVNPVDGQFYTILDLAFFAQDLASIDPQTGAVKDLGPLPSLIFNQSFTGLAFDSSGTLFALSSGGQLMTINTQNGSRTSLVSGLTVPDAGTPGGLAFDTDNGLLYHFGQDSSNNIDLESIDLSASSVQSISLTGDLPRGAGPLTYDPSQDVFETSASYPSSFIASLLSLTPQGVFQKLGDEQFAPTGLAPAPAAAVVTTPTAVPGGPYSALDGAAIVLDGTRSTSNNPAADTLTYEWDFNYDGKSFQVDATGPKPLAIFGDNPPSRTIALRVTDVDGNANVATTTVSVASAPPAVTAGGNVVLAVGTNLDRTGLFTDGEVHAWTGVVNYGDGSGDQTLELSSSQEFILDHRYASLGDYTVNVAVSDGNGGTGMASFDVNVVPATLNLNPIPALTGNEQTPLTFTAVGVDSQQGRVLTYSLDPGAPSGASIDPQTGVFTWTPSESEGPGTYPVTVRVTDNGTPPLATTTSFTITVGSSLQATHFSAVSGSEIFGEPATLSATLIAGDSPLAGETVTFTLDLDGTTTTAGAAVTDSEGVATLTGAGQTGLNAGTSTGVVAVSFAGDSADAGTSASGDLVVAPAQATLSLGGLVVTYDGSPVAATVTTSPANLSGVTVTYSQNGMTAMSPVHPGSYNVSATLNNPNYSAPSVNNTLVINQSTPAIDWPTPADLPAGTALGAAQLDATASVVGKFDYAPAAGAVLSAGPGQVLTVTFTPNDTVDYLSVSAHVAITVIAAPAPPHVTAIVAAGHNKSALSAITVAFDEPLVTGSAVSVGSYALLGGVKKRKATVYTKNVGKVRVSFDGDSKVTLTLTKPYKGAVQVTVLRGIVATDGAKSSDDFTAVIK